MTDWRSWRLILFNGLHTFYRLVCNAPYTGACSLLNDAFWSFDAVNSHKFDLRGHLPIATFIRMIQILPAKLHPASIHAFLFPPNHPTSVALLSPDVPASQLPSAFNLALKSQEYIYFEKSEAWQLSFISLSCARLSARGMSARFTKCTANIALKSPLKYRELEIRHAVGSYIDFSKWLSRHIVSAELNSSKTQRALGTAYRRRLSLLFSSSRITLSLGFVVRKLRVWTLGMESYGENTES